MSTALLFLVPVGILAVAWTFCFVGCHFPTGGLPDPYSNAILGETGLVAYWPLNDQENSPLPSSFPPPPQGSTSHGAAADFSGHGHGGAYIFPPNYAGDANSFPNPPNLIWGAGSIVAGDVSTSGTTDKLSNPNSVDFEGGYVSIPWSTQNPPTLTQFTLEAWIQPAWTGTGSAHVVFGALVTNGPNTATGFVLAIDENNHLQVVIGNGTAGVPISSTQVVIDPTTITYIAVTVDNTGLVNFFGNAVDGSPMTDSASSGYVPTPATQAGVTFFIGAGANDQPPRTTGGGAGGPLNPFQGQIQSVALYSGVLTDLITNHFADGSPG